MANTQQNGGNGEFEYRETFNIQKVMKQWEGIAQSTDDCCPINPTMMSKRRPSSSSSYSGSDKCPVNHNGTNGDAIDLNALKQNLTNMMGNGNGDPAQQELIVQVMTKLLAAQMHSNPPTDPAEREAAQALCPFLNGGELPSGYLTPNSQGSTTPFQDRSISPAPGSVPDRTSSPAPNQPEGPPVVTVTEIEDQTPSRQEIADAIPQKLKQQIGSLETGTRSKSMTDLAAMENQGMGPRRRSSLALARARANGSRAGSRRGSAANSRRNSVESCASDLGSTKTGKEPVKLMYYVDDKATVDTLHMKAAEVSSHDNEILRSPLSVRKLQYLVQSLLKFCSKVQFKISQKWFW